MKPYHYIESGLANVYLVNGPPSLLRPDIDGLHTAIGKLLVQKPHALDGAEVRFLRREMNLSQTVLGDRLGVCCQTVWRWEKDDGRIKREQDLTLRMTYLEFLDCACPREALAKLLSSKGVNRSPETMVLEKDHGQWRLPGQN